RIGFCLPIGSLFFIVLPVEVGSFIKDYAHKWDLRADFSTMNPAAPFTIITQDYDPIRMTTKGVFPSYINGDLIRYNLKPTAALKTGIFRTSMLAYRRHIWVPRYQQTDEQEWALGITRDDKKTYAKPISSTCRSSSDQDGDSYYHQCLDRWKHAWAD